MAYRHRSSTQRTLRMAGCPLLSIALLGGARAQIVTENAGVASPELPSLREAFHFERTREVREYRLDSQLTWSPTPRFETRTTLPWLHRDFRGGSDVTGIGDLALRGKHLLWQTDDVLESTRFSLLWEVTLPTGDDARAVGPSGVALRHPLQPGKGTIGYGAGAAFTLIRDRHRLSFEGFARDTPRHDGFDAGAVVSANVAYWYRITPATFGAAGERDPLEVRAVVELLAEQRFESRTARGLGDDGARLRLAPGVQVFSDVRVLFEAAFQLPLLDDVDDDFGRREWSALFSVKYLF